MTAGELVAAVVSGSITLVITLAVVLIQQRFKRSEEERTRVEQGRLRDEERAAELSRRLRQELMRGTEDVEGAVRRSLEVEMLRSAPSSAAPSVLIPFFAVLVVAVLLGLAILLLFAL